MKILNKIIMTLFLISILLWFAILMAFLFSDYAEILVVPPSIIVGFLCFVIWDKE